MADEEEDYMSDSFLLGLGNSRPGLVPDRVAKEYEKEAKRKDKQEKKKVKPLKERENEHREVALSSAIDSSNKGFALLQKMGYKEGMGLGKSEEGRKEPIPLSIKAGRGGLGRESELKRKQDTQKRALTMAREKRVKHQERQQDEFREKQKERFSSRQVEKDLFQSQKACEQLDKAKNLDRTESWYWPVIEDKKEEEDEEEKDEEEKEVEEMEYYEQLETSEKLVNLTEYLRRMHRYCIWCGATFSDDEDLNANCPGDSYGAHDE